MTKYLEFSIGNIPGYILEIEDESDIYTFLNAEDKMEALEDIFRTILPINVFDLFMKKPITFGWGPIAEDKLILCVAFGKVPNHLLEKAVLSSVLHREDFKLVKKMQCYALPKLSMLFEIPRCKGYVTKGKKEYHLHTSRILDDFLEKREIPFEEEVILDDIEKFFDKI